MKSGVNLRKIRRMDNFILKDSFKNLDNYIAELEKYAMIGMMAECLTHGYNSGMWQLRSQIEALPKGNENIKANFAKTTGLLYGMLQFTSLSSIRDCVKEKEFKDMLRIIDSRMEYELTIEENVNWFVDRTTFLAVVYELIMNAFKYGDVEIGKPQIHIGLKQIKIISFGKPPSNVDKIFKLKYTEGTNSKGFGLYIGKRLLNQMGYELRHQYRRSNKSNVFIIVEKK